MMNQETNQTDTQDQDEYWKALADQWETDHADIGSEFDN